MTNGVDIGTVIALIQAQFGGEVASAVSAYFDEHPEATVPDNAVTYAKLNQVLQGKVDAFDALGFSVVNGMVCQTYQQ